MLIGNISGRFPSEAELHRGSCWSPVPSTALQTSHGVSHAYADRAFHTWFMLSASALAHGEDRFPWTSMRNASHFLSVRSHGRLASRFLSPVVFPLRETVGWAMPAWLGPCFRKMQLKVTAETGCGADDASWDSQNSDTNVALHFGLRNIKHAAQEECGLLLFGFFFATAASTGRCSVVGSQLQVRLACSSLRNVSKGSASESVTSRYTTFSVHETCDNSKSHYSRAHKDLATSRLELWCVGTLAEVVRTSIVVHCVCQDVCTHFSVREGQALTDVTLLSFDSKEIQARLSSSLSRTRNL